MRVLSVSSRYSDQPEAEVITASRIKDADCPYRYFKNYVETPRQPKPFVSIELGMGQFFHDFLQHHFKQIMAEGRAIARRDQIDLDELLERFRLSFLWEGRLREPYHIVRQDQSIAHFEERLRTVGANFNHFLLAELVKHQVMSIEGELQIRTDSCFIRGKHDLITTSPHGRLVLWDWKTGRKPKPEYFREFEVLKAQLGAYAIWMRHSYDTTDVRGTAVFLRETPDLQLEDFKPSVEQDVLAYMSRWRSKLNQMTTYPRSPSILCAWCPWKGACPAAKGITVYAQSRGRRERSGPCFVATAVFGDSESREVAVFRRFRDAWLVQSRLGRLLIGCYYIVGPEAAALVERHPKIRAPARWLLKGLASMLQRPFVPPKHHCRPRGMTYPWCSETREAGDSGERPRMPTWK